MIRASDSTDSFCERWRRSWWRAWQRVVVVGGLLLATAAHTAAVELPGLFNHHMVLQREMPVPVFGLAQPGTNVAVAFADQSVAAVAGDDGRWRVALAPMAASADGREMTITGTDTGGVVTTVVLRDVLVGEVWFGCGQSNMVIPVNGSGYSRDYDLERSRPLIRYSGTPSDRVLKPAKRDPTGFVWNPEWLVCTPDNIPQVGGILFAFADQLHAELGVPIGIVNRAIGGNPVRSFIDQARLADDPIVTAELERLAESHAADQLRAERKAELWQDFCEQYDRKTREEMGFRRSRGLASGTAGQAAIADRQGNGYRLLLSPILGFACRGVVWDQGESGVGMLANRVGLGFATRALIRQWRTIWPDVPFIVMQKPSGHGRNAWGQYAVAADEVVPLPATPPQYPWTSGYKAHEYLSVIREPSTWLVNTMDMQRSVHPVRKDVNGVRASEIALSEVYGLHAGTWRAPEYARAEFANGRAVVHFSHVGDGFEVAGGGPIAGFALAGDDQVFHWAEATVVGETVEVHSPQVPNPIAVRYAFAYKQAPWANLFGANGRPVLVFRSDDWIDVP